MTQNEKAARVRQEVERMEQERVMVHGVEVKPGQVWEYEPHEGLPSRVANIRDGAILCRDGLDWEPSVFATWHKRLAQPTQPDEAPRWTDAEWAAEQVALSRRQADAARAEARELRAELVEAHRAHRESCDASLPIEAELAERRADVEAYKLTVANMMRMLGRSPSADLRLAELAVGAEVKEVDKLREELAETRHALEAARAAVPSPGGTDGPSIGKLHAAVDGLNPPSVVHWSPPVLTVDEARRLLDEGREISKEVKRRLDRMERPPGGSDPATRTRARAEVPPYDPGTCESCRNQIEGRDYYRNRDVGDVGGDNYHRDCWEWVRSNGTGPRPRPFRGALPVVPATCGMCEHEAGEYCQHPQQFCCEPVNPHEPPPVWCKLAKAGGA